MRNLIIINSYYKCLFCLMMAILTWNFSFAQADIELNQVSTRYAPWMDQLHITGYKELNAGATKGGEGGQRPFGLAVSPSKPEYVALVTDTYGAWLTKNEGKNWMISEGQPLLQGGVNIAFHPDDENILFYAASPQNANNREMTSNYSGIWRTGDGGTTWQHVLHVEYFRYESCNIICFGPKSNQNSRTIYIGSHNNGVYKSTDNGYNWSHFGLPNTKIVDLHFDTVSSMLIAISEAKGVMVAGQDGAWTSRNNGISSEKPTSIAVNPVNSDHWFLVSENKLFESNDAGQNWTQISRPTGFGSNVKLYRLAFGAADSTGNPRLYCQAHKIGGNFRYSKDLGKTWGAPVNHSDKTFFDGLNGYFYGGLAVHPSKPLIVYTDLNDVIFRSEDGGENFYPANQGFSGLRASDFCFTHSNPDVLYIAAIDHGLFRSVPHGIEGVYPLFEYAMRKGVDSYDGANTVHSIAVNPLNHEHLLMNIGNWGSNNILSQSFNGGKTWTQVPGTVGTIGKGIFFHPQDTSIIYAGSNFSSDGGLTWQTRNKRVMAVSPIDGNTVYTVDNNRLYVSRNMGASWEYMEGTSPQTLPAIKRVLADLVEMDKVWLATQESNYGIILIRKVGDSFSRTIIGEAQGLKKSILGNRICINDLAQNPDNPLHMVAGGVDATGRGLTPGLFESLNGGMNWHLVTGMPGRRDIWTMDFQPGTGRVFMGTSAGTFIYNSITNSSVEKTNDNSIGMHVYPNPNKGFFSVKLDNPVSSGIEVSVFNIAGNVFFCRSFRANEPINMDITGNPPGMYYISIMANNKRMTDKVILSY